MELKLFIFLNEFTFIKCSNRTFMELKLDSIIRVTNAIKRF